MSTSDAARSNLALSDRLEADLVELLAIQPSAGIVDRLDERIDGAMRRFDPRASRRSRLRPSRRTAAIGLLAAAFVLAGATGSVQGLYQLLAGPFDTPWHRGVEVNLSQVVDGYRVTIDRAYADPTRLALAISVVDERKRPGTTQLSGMSTVVSDASGTYSGTGATSSPDGPYAASNVVWLVPAALPLPSGPRWFHVVVPTIMVRGDATPPPVADSSTWDPWHDQPGPWAFDFQLNVDGGTTVTPNAAAEVNGVRVTVSRLIAAPSTVRLELQIDGNLPAGGWTPTEGEVQHGGQTLRFVAAKLGSSGAFAIETDGGVDDASGQWTVTIGELSRGNATLAGPWVLQFNAP